MLQCLYHSKCTVVYLVMYRVPSRVMGCLRKLSHNLEDVFLCFDLAVSPAYYRLNIIASECLLSELINNDFSFH